MFSLSVLTEGLNFNKGTENITLALQNIVIEPIFDYRFSYYEPGIILVNENDYEMFGSLLDVYSAKVHWLDITDWKQSTEVVNELKEKLHTKIN